MQTEKELKFILLGEGSVGKTCIMLRLAGKPIRHTHIYTIGIDVENRKYNFDGNNFHIKIWDTAGQEKYRNSLTRDIFHRLHGAFLVYDVSNKESFEKITHWMELIKREASENTSVILVANKIDLDFEVTREEGKELAQEFCVPFVETSAKTQENIDFALELLLKTTVEKNPELTRQESSRSIRLSEKTEPKKRCC